MREPDYRALTERIIEMVSRPIDWEKYAAEQAARTDPWCWYCRLCGASGQDPDEGGRDWEAGEHLRTTRCGRFPVVGSARAGRMLHVWTYPASALAELN